MAEAKVNAKSRMNPHAEVEKIMGSSKDEFKERMSIEKS